MLQHTRRPHLYTSCCPGSMRLSWCLMKVTHRMNHAVNTLGLCPLELCIAFPPGLGNVVGAPKFNNPPLPVSLQNPRHGAHSLLRQAPKTHHPADGPGPHPRNGTVPRCRQICRTVSTQRDAAKWQRVNWRVYKSDLRDKQGHIGANWSQRRPLSLLNVVADTPGAAGSQTRTLSLQLRPKKHKGRAPPPTTHYLWHCESIECPGTPGTLAHPTARALQVGGNNASCH